MKKKIEDWWKSLGWGRGGSGKKGKEEKTSFLFVLGGSLVVFSLTGVTAGLRTPLPESNIPDIEVEERKIDWPLNVRGMQAPETKAASVAILDVNSDRLLFAKKAEEPRLPASTTKVMTAWVVLAAVERGELFLDQVVAVPEVAVKADGQKVGLALGEQLTIENLLYALLLGSGNDAAEVLAAAYPGGKVAMVAAMNRKVDGLGLKRTHFTNPEGFDEYLHFTTAEDMAILCREALKNKHLAGIVGTTEASFFSFDGKIPHDIRNLNQLLGEVPGVKGIKTGWTEVAGENLVTAVERDGHEVIVVVLASSDRFGDSKKLIGWVFDNFSWPDGANRSLP